MYTYTRRMKTIGLQPGQSFVSTVMMCGVKKISNSVLSTVVLVLLKKIAQPRNVPQEGDLVLGDILLIA